VGKLCENYAIRCQNYAIFLDYRRDLEKNPGLTTKKLFPIYVGKLTAYRQNQIVLKLEIKY